MKTGMNSSKIEDAYGIAKEAYAKFGVSSDKAIKDALSQPVSVQCWQGDDVTGFEKFEDADFLFGDIAARGNYPGRARNGDELRGDAEFAFSLIPGKKRFNLHSFYAETDGRKISRDTLKEEHFSKWMSWSKKKKIPIDFNPSFFFHPLADSGYTLASADTTIRKFWIHHAVSCRRIASAFGENQGNPAVSNIWVPDGSKDYPADRLAPRERLMDALDEIFADKVSADTICDAVECKFFGTGSEAYAAGSHEFYLAYAAKKQIRLCLNTGRLYPAENAADKISAALLFVPGLLIHFGRGVHWDSGYAAVFSDEMRDVCREIKRANAFDRTALALDYFDASINRIAAWVIGARSLRKALLESLLEPTRLIVEAEKRGRNHERLALIEESKTLPFAAVWDKLCLTADVPVSVEWLTAINEYEQKTLGKRK